MCERIFAAARALGFDDAQLTETEGGDTALVLFRAYALPSSLPARGRIRLSGYYIASHKSYLAAAELQTRLTGLGVTARAYKERGLKRLAARACGGIGKNTLFLHPRLGSCVAIQALLLDLDADVPVHVPEDVCGACDLCARACPSRAVTESGFRREECIRSHTGLPRIPPQYGKYIYQLIGCERCQAACPRNAEIGRPSAPTREFDLVETLEGRHTREIRGLIGANFGKRAAILNQALFYAANTGYTPALPAARALSGDECCAEAARFAEKALSAEADSRAKK